MKVLFLHANKPDYLAETLFHGLRSLLDNRCVDFPRYDSLYAPISDALRSKLRGYGFSIYGLLEERPELAVARYYWQQDLAQYDLIIVAHLSEQWHLIPELLKSVPPEKIVLLDGSDYPTLYPYTTLLNRLRRAPGSLLVPYSKLKYFKRELMGKGSSYGLHKVLPPFLRTSITPPANTRPIAFSIPQEKIWRSDAPRPKNFPVHIVDPEVAQKVADAVVSKTGSSVYAFKTEADYYQDLRNSRFGITTKRAGWDCLRHYELAANGCVLCFKDLDLKEDSCAPHGLNASNCIIYRNAEDLYGQIEALSEPDYCLLQARTYDWISQNTTIARAMEFLRECYPAHAIESLNSVNRSACLQLG